MKESWAAVYKIVNLSPRNLLGVSFWIKLRRTNFAICTVHKILASVKAQIYLQQTSIHCIEQASFGSRMISSLVYTVNDHNMLCLSHSFMVYCIATRPMTCCIQKNQVIVFLGTFRFISTPQHWSYTPATSVHLIGPFKYIWTIT